VVGDAALDAQLVVVLREVASDAGRGARILGMEREAADATEQRNDRLVGRVLHGEADRRVLVDVVRAPRLAELGAQVVGRCDRESCELDEHERVARAQLFSELVAEFLFLSRVHGARTFVGDPSDDGEDRVIRRLG
jgi:hypothetical protein